MRALVVTPTFTALVRRSAVIQSVWERESSYIADFPRSGGDVVHVVNPSVFEVLEDVVAYMDLVGEHGHLGHIPRPLTGDDMGVPDWAATFICAVTPLTRVYTLFRAASALGMPALKDLCAARVATVHRGIGVSRLRVITGVNVACGEEHSAQRRFYNDLTAANRRLWSDTSDTGTGTLKSRT